MTRRTSVVSISCEFFPPKSLEGAQRLLVAATELQSLSPDFFSVTFGAGGSTRSGTYDTVKTLLQKTPIAVAPHLSCLGFAKEDLLDMLGQYKKLGVKRIVALRGDLPENERPSSLFKLAYDLIKFVREVTGDYFHIEVAAYPECHPEAKNALYDVFNLKRKYEAGANSAITQYFFNPDAYFYFLDECARQEIFIPIVPGVMPITQLARLARFSALCGAEIPRWLYKRLEAYGDDEASVCAFGTEVVAKMCERLLAGGAPGLHFYTLNQAAQTMHIMAHLDLGHLEAKAARLAASNIVSGL